jgi:hypothetical protein
MAVRLAPWGGQNCLMPHSFSQIRVLHKSWGGPGRGPLGADAKGMFLAAVGVGLVYKLLDKKDLGTTEMPPIETALIQRRCSLPAA